MKKTPRSRHEEKTGITEGDLIEAFEQVVLESNPNASRCPGRKVKRVVTSQRLASQAILDHIAACAACLKE